MWWPLIRIVHTRAPLLLPHYEAHWYLDRGPRRYPQVHALLSCLQQVAMSVFATLFLQSQEQIVVHG